MDFHSNFLHATVIHHYITLPHGDITFQISYATDSSQLDFVESTNIDLKNIYRYTHYKTLILEWNRYCLKQYLPSDWFRYIGDEVPLPIDLDDADTPQERSFMEWLIDQHFCDFRETPPQVQHPQPREATCIGHLITPQGKVFMKLAWEDGFPSSIHPVSKVMKSLHERQSFAATWYEYCERNLIFDNSFRIMGVFRVQDIP
jgi:hypothetical protein